jgi:hypothetical protein
MKPELALEDAALIADATTDDVAGCGLCPLGPCCQ